ncbi:hypothetical protein OG698_17290 [Streptomyces sp. NBC_01003]|uniref:hypothetical protein n=1 Tax=Streptomyces sp. NBC_01003 TaxID=2903714 RepID=UPI003862F3CE|nr:hypothetical protein OG698_17290 [Streptomyces sp. NBC_01003]
MHGQLESLSKMLALQIEALVVTVDASKTGYNNLDDDVRARLSRIRSEADALLERGPNAKSSAGPDSSAGADHSEPTPKATDSEAGGL